MEDVEISPAAPPEVGLLLADSRRTFAESPTRHRGLRRGRRGPGRAGHRGPPPRRRTDARPRFLAARRDGELAGGVWVAVTGPDRPDAAWIHHLWVAPPGRRRGLGRRLVEAAADAVRERGARHRQLNVFGDNAGAIALEEELGFAVSSQQRSRPLD